MFFRTIGISTIFFSVLISGAVIYNVPLMPNFTKSYWSKFLVYCLGKFGACSTKLGQWAATRPDLFPESICAALSELHTRAPAHKFEHTQNIVKHAFGKSIEEVFVEFDEKVIASGAIAQVHRAAVLDLTTGHTIDVAVKVRHPTAKDSISNDLTILRFLGNLSGHLPGVKWMSVKENIDTFAVHMEKQLDLLEDGNNLRKFNENFKGYDNICFPRPFLQLSNQEILVETFEVGIQVQEYISKSSIYNINTSDKFKKQLANLGFTAFLKMVFIDNFIHADLHPGNVLVRERDSGAQIVFLDAGLVTSLGPTDRANFLDLFGAVAAGNGYRGAELMIERAPEQQKPPPELQEKFKNEVKKIFDEVTSYPLGEIPIGRAFLKMLGLCRECRVKIEGNFSSLMTGLLVVEGLARQLHAKFDLMKEARPLLITDKDAVKAYLRNRL